MKKACIITIGDELLIGQTIDTNSAYIAQALNKIGIQISERVAVADNEKQILDSIAIAEKKNDIVIFTGGLGPTKDDITKKTLCKYFKTELILHKPTLRFVKAYFAKRKRVLLDSNLGQAYLPKNCKVLPNKRGTAPGMLFTKNKKIIISLPGVPFEMEYLMDKEIIPYLKKNAGGGIIVHKTMLTSGLGESFIAERLKEFENNLPKEIQLAYLPSYSSVKLRLSTYNEKGAKQILNEFKKMKNLLPDILLIDEDSSIEKVIFNLLKKNNKTFSLAESCTGGDISSKFIGFKGLSSIFRGSGVFYHEGTKSDILGIDKKLIKLKTVYSEEVASAMAQRARKVFKSDYALSTSGMLDGEETFVYCSVSSKKKTICKKFLLPYTRDINLKYASQMAMQYFVKFLITELK